MAGSRLDKIGNIFSRATGLLRSGVVKYEDRPMWYDIYRVFPPKYEPRFNREIDLTKHEVKPIFYEEDLIRADFYKHYGPNPGGIVRDLKAFEVEDDCHKFIAEYNETRSANPEWKHEAIFKSVASSFNITVHRPGRRNRQTAFLPSSSIQSAQTEEQIDHDEEIETSQLAMKRKTRRANIISSSTLLSLFKEAQEDKSKVVAKDRPEKSKKDPE